MDIEGWRRKLIMITSLLGHNDIICSIVSGVETASHTGHCPINLKVIHVHHNFSLE